METRGRTRDGNEGGRGDGNESSSGDGNGDEDGKGDRNEDGIGEGGGEAKKPHKSCRLEQALLSRTRHYLCRQGVVLAGTQQLRSQGPVSVHAHRAEGVTGSERREGANGVGVKIGVGGGNGDVNGGVVRRLEGAGMSQISPRFGRGRHENSPSRGLI